MLSQFLRIASINAVFAAMNALRDCLHSALTQHPNDGRDKRTGAINNGKQWPQSEATQFPPLTDLHLFHFLSHFVFAEGIMGWVIGRDWDNGTFQPPSSGMIVWEQR